MACELVKICVWSFSWQNIFKPSMALTAVRSKAVITLLLFVVLAFVCGCFVFGPFFLM